MLIYHIARNNQKIATCTQDELPARYASGEILPTDLLWADGMPDWSPAEKILGQPLPPLGETPPPVPSTSPAPQYIATKPPKPDSYLVQAILATLFCCLPFGVVSIVFAAQVDGKYNSGDYAGAEDSAKKARQFFWTSLILGLSVTIIYAAFMFVAAATGH